MSHDESLDLIEQMVMEEEEDMTNKWVWTRHPEHEWVQVKVVSMLYDDAEPNQTKEYLIEHPHFVDNFQKVLVKDVHRVDATHNLDLDDVCLMNDMHEAPLLDLLRRRFFQHKIHTYTGEILISINPYERIPNSYDTPLDFFSITNGSGILGALQFDQRKRRPHVYEIANNALCSLITTDGEPDDNQELSIKNFSNQSVIISGESGAGKTENSKFVVHFLVSVNTFLTTRQHDAADSAFAVQIQDMLEKSSVLLEAFGNAKTSRNDNSSRFGKYTKLLYVQHFETERFASPVPRLVTAQTDTFLLEKSRLVVINEGERCFHVLHQFHAGAKSYDSGLCDALCVDHDVSRFQLLTQGEAGESAAGDASQFLDTLAAMRAVQCTEDEIRAVLSLLAAVLHLSNVVLNDGAPGDPSEGSGGEIVKLHCPTMPVDSLAALLGVDVTTFKLSLTMQQLVIARRSSLKVKVLSPAEVANNLSALVKWIYSELFNWVVLKINHFHAVGVESRAAPSSFIGILDIFGFEIMGENSFEQLCINFANERLQQQFNSHVFVTEQEMYRSEGLRWSAISFRDNQPIIDVLAGATRPRLGLLPLMEELGMLNRKPDDAALIASFNQTHDAGAPPRSSKDKEKEKPLYARHKFIPTRFVLQHFAGEVTYSVEGFLAKNNDTLQSDLMKLMLSTSNVFLRNLMKCADCCAGQCGFIDTPRPAAEPAAPAAPATAAKRLASAASVSAQFRAQLDSLMSTLGSTKPHYIKCVKPNADKSPRRFDAALVIQQLRCSGVLEVVRIRRDGFPLRMGFHEFYRDYAILAKGKNRGEFPDPLSCSLEDAKRCCGALLSECFGPEQFQIGHSIVFLRENGRAMMSDAIKAVFHNKVSRVQALFKSKLQRQNYRQFLQRLVKLQAAIRAFVYRLRFVQTKLASDYVKRYLRSAVLRLRFLEHNARVCHERKVRRVTTVQRLVRGFISRREFRRRLAAWLGERHGAAVMIQKHFRGFSRRFWLANMQFHLAAVAIQSAARRRIALCAALRRAEAVLVVQSFARMCLARFLLAQALCAAVQFQALARGFVARRRYQRQRLSAVKIQSFARRIFAFRWVFLRVMSVWVIQSAMHRWLAKRRYLRQRSAAIAIQKHVRRHLATQLVLGQCFAAFSIQRVMRGAIARRRVRRELCALIALQSVMRMCAARRAFLSVRGGAVSVQCAWRRCLARKSFRMRMRRVVVAQSCARRFLAARAAQRRYLALLRAQSAVRMFVCMIRYITMRFVVERLQAHARRRICSHRFVRAIHSVCLIQACARRAVAMRYRRNALRAVVLMQALARRAIQRTRFLAQRARVVRAQTAARGLVDRARFLRTMRLLVVLQSWARMATKRAAYHRCRAAAVRLQSISRMTICRRAFLEQCARVVCLQSLARRRAAMTRYRRERQRVVALQSWARKVICKNDFSRKRSAAVVMQSAARRYIAVCRALWAQLSALIIQSYVRRHMARHRYESMKRSIVRLQAFARKVFAKRRIREMHRAQVAVSRVYRGHSQRAKLATALRAMRCIQRNGRQYLHRKRLVERVNALFSSQQGSHDDPAVLLAHLDEFPADRTMRHAAHDMCSLVQFLLVSNEIQFVAALQPTTAEALDIDKFSRNSAHYLAMYPSADGFKLFFELLGSFKDDPGRAPPAVMALDADDGNDNDGEFDDDDENLMQLKMALSHSVGRSTLKQGWIKKKRGGWSWQKRWLVLTEDYIIYYKTPQSTNDPKFAIPTQGCSIQRSAGRDPIFELSSENITEKKTLFGGTKSAKTVWFFAESEKDLQEWLTPLRAVTGVKELRANLPVKYIHTEVCQLWVAAVDKNLETPLHLLVRYHCMRNKLVTNDQKKTRRMSLIKRIRQSIAVKVEEHTELTQSLSSPFKLHNLRAISMEETLQILAWLVELGCPVNGQNNKGETALHLALRNSCDPQLICALLLKGADPNGFKDDFKLTPLEACNALDERKAEYLEILSGTQVATRTSNERSLVNTTKLKGLSYASLFIGHQDFESSRMVINERSRIVISAYNRNKQFIEASRELSGAVWYGDDKTDHSNPFWGCVWHMQTPLENLEVGSYLLIEYKPTGGASTAIGTVDLDMNTINSGSLSISLGPAQDGSFRANPLLANASNDKSILHVEMLLNQRNRPIDFRQIFGM